jgi:hypothetical protein
MMYICDSLVSSHALSDTDILHATDVTVRGLVFTGVCGTQHTMFPSESIMVTCSRDDSEYFKDCRLSVDEDSSFTLYESSAVVTTTFNMSDDYAIVNDPGYFSITTASG